MTTQLTALRDQWQQNFATVQGQLGQLSLNTQMILDQQQRAQNPPTRHFLEQSRSSSTDLATSRRQLGHIQPFVGQHDNVFAQDPPIGVQFPSSPATARHNELCHTLLPMSAVSLEEETTNLQTLERRMRTMHSKRIENSKSFTFCTCRKRLQRKQFSRSPFVVSRDEVHYHDSSCQFWTTRGHDTTIGFGMILCYLVLGLKLRLFMQLSIGSGTFSIMPNLTFGRIVTVESSAAFKLIDSICDPNRNLCPVKDYPVALNKIFQTRQASPHDRLQDGKSLLHVSIGTPFIAV